MSRLRPVACLIACLMQVAAITPLTSDKLLAPWDPVASHMPTPPAPIYPQQDPSLEKYFERPIPKVVHQIWFGDLSRMDRRGPAQWRDFANKFGYVYRLWTDDDEHEFKDKLLPQNYAIWRAYRRMGDLKGASDILRMALLEQDGGIYVDVDFRPPFWQGELVDLESIMPMRNAVFMTEQGSRYVIKSSLIVCNGFMMAAPHHPIFEQLTHHLKENIEALHEGPFDENATEIRLPPHYMSGPIYLSRVVSGVFTILPYHYSEVYHMHDYDPGIGMVE